QSMPIESRETLEKNYQQYNEKFNTGDIPRPKNWGGYIVHPNSIEFWQGRQGRLHDRLQYSLSADKTWKIERLSP
ncbi:MAG: pyridoxine 5'-phosphate oxidase C-terminal domain-containing protein, partial [Ginsengibacter sp.]